MHCVGFDNNALVHALHGFDNHALVHTLHGFDNHALVREYSSACAAWVSIIMLLCMHCMGFEILILSQMQLILATMHAWTGVGRSLLVSWTHMSVLEAFLPKKQIKLCQ
jgi:hypothetical protein